MTLEGKPAPDFTLLRDGGETVTLSGLRPAKVVLYFYPKDDTSGCTLEAQGFTEAKRAFEAEEAVVLGISRDTVAKHDKFIDKYGLDVILAADTEGEVCEAYGVWVEKSMYGRKYMGIGRSTFLIGADGTVLREWRGVKVPGHVDEVLDAVKAA